MKSIFDLYCETLNESKVESIVLNEAFQSKSIQQIYSSGPMGKSFINGLSEYGIALNEIKEGSSIIEIKPTQEGETSYHSYVHKEAKKLSNKRTYQSSDRGKDEQKISPTNFDVIVINKKGMQARYRESFGGGSHVIEKSKEFNKAKVRSLNDLGDYLAENKDSRVFIMIVDPKTRKSVKEGKNLEFTEGLKRLTSGLSGLEIEYFDGGTFKVKNKAGKPVCELKFQNSTRRVESKGDGWSSSKRDASQFSREDATINYYSSSLHLDNKDEINIIKDVVAATEYFDKNLDKIVDLLKKSTTPDQN